MSKKIKSKFKVDKKYQPKSKPWKKHKQVMVSTMCGVRVEIDKNIAGMIRFINTQGVETRYSCEGRGLGRGYVSMFATPKALGFAHYLINNGSKASVVIERDIDPDEHERLCIRWPKKKQPEFEALVYKYFR